MPKVTPTPIAELATALPDPGDPTTYGTRGRAVWAWETDALVPGANTLAEQTLQNAEHAEDMAILAEAVSFLQGEWSGLTGALNMPAVVTHTGEYWVLLSNLADVTASEPGVSGDWAPYERPNAAQVEFDGTNAGSDSVNVQQALDELFIGPNLVDNVRFLSGRRFEGRIGSPTSVAAGVFFVDRWKAGSGGVAFSGLGTSPFASTITMTSGSVVQQIFQDFPFSGVETVTLAWDGGAEGRINGGAWAVSPIVYTFPSFVQKPEIEFRPGVNGSLSDVRLRLGTVDYGIRARETKTVEEEYEYLARYYQRVEFYRVFVSAVANENNLVTVGVATMVAVPSPVVISTSSSVNVSAFAVAASSRNHIRVAVNANAGSAVTESFAVIGLDSGY